MIARILPSPSRKVVARWHGDERRRRLRAVTNNRTRLVYRRVAKEAFKLRAEIVEERSFAHNLDRGGMTPDMAARARERCTKRYLLHVAWPQSGSPALAQWLIGAGTPRVQATWRADNGRK